MPSYLIKKKRKYIFWDDQSTSYCKWFTCNIHGETSKAGISVKCQLSGVDLAPSSTCVPLWALWLKLVAPQTFHNSESEKVRFWDRLSCLDRVNSKLWFRERKKWGSQYRILWKWFKVMWSSARFSCSFVTRVIAHLNSVSLRIFHLKTMRNVKWNEKCQRKSMDVLLCGNLYGLFVLIRVSGV